MGTLLRLPVDEAAFARLVQRERQANMVAERAGAVEDARAVLRSPKRHSDQILRDACAVLQAWGDGQDYLTADAMIFAMNRRERLRAHNAALEAARRAESEETPVRIALREARRGTIRAEVLDRSQAQDRFGSDLVARWEEIQTEKLQ